MSQFACPQCKGITEEVCRKRQKVKDMGKVEPKYTFCATACEIGATLMSERVEIRYCSVPGCFKRVDSKGFCRKHYYRTIRKKKVTKKSPLTPIQSVA